MRRSNWHSVLQGLVFFSLLASLSAYGAEPLTPEADRRSGDQTFLTYPEWFLVHSPTEYASYVKERPPTEFPFFGHIRQLWSSYGAMYSEVKDNYQFNGEYHTMIMVIGVSTTIEYGLRAAWETLIGRLTEWSAGSKLSPEDSFGATVADDYARFILTTPWYEFDYWQALEGLWQTESLTSNNLLRRLERRYLLTSEYLIKAGYAKLIKLGAQSSFTAPEPTTMSVISAPENGLTDGQSIEYGLPIKDRPGLWLKSLPRYHPFTEQARELARRGVSFAEIAGNRGDILVTVLGPINWSAADTNARDLFTQPLLTQPGTVRRALAVPVADLHSLLLSVDQSPASLEHIYDY